VFEPRPFWYELLPEAEARRRLEREEIALWPDITPGEAVGLGWALLVSDREEEVWSRAREVPGFRWSAVGLLDPELDRELRGDEPPFGVILYAEDEQGEQGRRKESLVFEEIPLPVVVRPGGYTDQRSASPLLGHGRLACWATSRRGARSGWLTARHVADHPAMSAVGSVVDRAPECIDAAVVDVGVVGGGSVQALATPAPGGKVDVDLPIPLTATILDVATNLGVRRSSRFPMRFSVNAAGVAGDSGSLMRGLPCGEPLGLYLGSFAPVGVSTRSGIGLALTQIEYFMDLEVYG
jgi:hypothetical protein